MSWSGTVRCRVCWENGHNKRTCPQWTENLRIRAQREYDADGTIDGYNGRTYAKRTGKYIDGTDATALKATRAGSVRRCKYCGSRGHNRRTCTVLKADTANYIANALTFRRGIVEDMKRLGIGVGSLMQAERWGDKYLMLCEQVQWQHIHHHMGNAEIFGGRRCGTGSWVSTGYPEGEYNSSSYHNYACVGPVSAEGVAAAVPDDFFTEESVAGHAAEAFANAQSDCFYDNRYV